MKRSSFLGLLGGALLGAIAPPAVRAARERPALDPVTPAPPLDIQNIAPSEELVFSRPPYSFTSDDIAGYCGRVGLPPQVLGFGFDQAEIDGKAAKIALDKWREACQEHAFLAGVYEPTMRQYPGFYPSQPRLIVRK